MTRQQKIILLTLAILDIAMIGALITYAATTTQRTRQLHLTPDVVGTDPCVAAVLEAFAEPNDTTLIDWSPSGAHIEITRSASEPDTPPEEFIWELIDHLPADLEAHCPPPTTITLVAHTGTPRRHTQTVVFAGSDLTHWLRGALSDDDLARKTQYRIVSAP